jgi:hydroxyethylthiazole kinase
MIDPNDAFSALRKQAPLVHCITNYVAMNIAANVTLAAGASPAMLHAAEEVTDFVPLAGALTINIGTLSAPWVASMTAAANAAQAADVPWVLDPVAHFVSPYRTGVAQDLLALQPTILRGNASEIIALSGAAGAGKGADSGDSVADARAAALTLAKTHGCVVGVSGPQDFITDGTRVAHVTGGSELMPRVTALGCSLTALVGGFAAVCPAFDATVAAFGLFAEAGARAAQQASGPGSFQVAFLDQLHALQPGDLDRGRVTCG